MARLENVLDNVLDNVLQIERVPLPFSSFRLHCRVLLRVSRAAQRVRGRRGALALGAACMPWGSDAHGVDGGRAT